MQNQTGAPLNVPLEGLLEIENGLPYLKFTSGDTGLARFHRSLMAISKKRPNFLGTTCLDISRPTLAAAQC